MHPVSLSDYEYKTVKEALESGEWRKLRTNKLRYLYQRFTKNDKHIQEIAKEAVPMQAAQMFEI